MLIFIVKESRPNACENSIQSALRMFLYRCVGNCPTMTHQYTNRVDFYLLIFLIFSRAWINNIDFIIKDEFAVVCIDKRNLSEVFIINIDLNSQSYSVTYSATDLIFNRLNLP